MYKRLSIVSTLALGSVLLLGNVLPSAFSSALAQEKTIAQMTPKSGWSVARVNGNANTAEKYCALSRQYDQGLVVTLGRNEAEEYSLAIDFQAAQLNTEKAYSLTLQPGPGQIRAYEMMPASQSAMVIRLGYDDSFFKALEDSNLLKVEMDGTNYHFQMSDFSSGKTDLNNCLDGLKGKEPTKVAKGFSAEKVADASPIVPKKIEAVKAPVKVEVPKLAEAIKVEPKPAAVVEPAKLIKTAETAPEVIPQVTSQPAVKMEEPTKPVTIEKVEKTSRSGVRRVQLPKRNAPKPIEIKRIKTRQISPEMPVKIEVAESKEEVSKPAGVKSSQGVIRSNNDSLLKKTLASKKASEQESKQKTKPVEKQVSKKVAAKPSVQQVVAQTALQKKQRGALEQLKADNERLNKALRAEVSKPSVNTPDRSGEVAVLKTQLDKLQSELVKTKLEGVKSVSNPVDEKLKSDVETLRQENEQLKLAMQTQEKARAAILEKKQAQEQKAQAEKAKQAMAIQAQAKKAEAEKMKAAEKISKQTKPQQKVATGDPDVMRQLKDLKADNTRLSAALQGQGKKLSSFDVQSPEAEKELVAIRAELHELQQENKKLYEDSRKARGQVDTAVATTSNQALKKMREYENKLNAAQNDNLALSKEIEELRRMKEDGRLSAASGDWDLEKSTKRYNEAEREIKRLGMLMEQQRMAHRQEKAELEGMLFDPAVTDQEQRRRLMELELQLSDAEKELRGSGRSLPQRRRIPLSPVEERVTLGSMTPDPIVAQQRENLEIQRLNNKVARQNNQLQAYNRQHGERMAAVPSPAVNTQPLSAPRRQRPAPTMPAPTMVEPPRVKSQSQPQVSGSTFNQGQLQTLLNSAGLSLKGNVTKQGGGRYRWNVGNLVGQARVVPKAQAGNLNQFTQNYISKARQFCGGDFASLPSTSGGQGKAFEIACISQSHSTSSSVVFIQKGNEMIAISHETSAENMDMAMDARDRIAAKL